ncbi:probable inactive nicotinamidase At3g16190 [Zingiber officinale]|uniref:probable inactive nicotinamidase At3g16190 n=1 Tax=Zingiber officinale TaxID=94328 RepID=UPI001C4B214F|nr:probable inactive nicotinamidase At3g16190 [Zingiber officinale]
MVKGQGRSGADLVEGLVIKDEDYKVVKTRFSAFFATNLHQLLQGCGIKNLVVIGKGFKLQTVFDAVALDYHQVLSLQIQRLLLFLKFSSIDNIRDMKNIGVATPTLQEWLQL